MKTRLLTMARLGILSLALTLAGCSTQIAGSDSTGSPVTIRAGFGNSISVDPSIKIIPDPNIVAAGERVATVGIKMAPDVVARIAERRAEQ